MSTSIRPPGGPASTGAVGLDGASEVSSSSDAGSVDQVGSTHATNEAQAAPVESPTAALLARLDAGEITREQAIESLVADALSSQAVASLDPAQRGELEEILRASLLEDPTLARLLS